MSILLLGLLIGMQHALEADHVAAVASIAARQTSVARIVRHGAVWGLGHTITLMAFGGAALLLDLTIGAALAGWLEAVVGVMLVGLGGQVIYRLVRDRIHFHLHRHGDGQVHFHAHSHAGESGAHDPADHDHDHPRGLPLRTLLVGMMHGMAGSAALLILTASTVGSPGLGLAYIALFGLGSIAGMAALSAVIAVPLAYSARLLTRVNTALQAVVGTATVALGLVVLNNTVAGLLS
ncbi:MAG: urease accessory protein [Hyphomicrobiales bacterium]|nr:urease accessory protein [Hyphomicrobiales bacterium]